jgi:hypothetical protein
MGSVDRITGDRALKIPGYDAVDEPDRSLKVAARVRIPLVSYIR